ncbi:hypothetical protein CDEF62S_00501 [Castellaniella defragrans]
MSYFVELVANGALTGLMYGLVALGFVLIFKSSGVLNLAQGTLVMSGAYVVWWLTTWGVPVWLAIVLGLVIMFVFGLLSERLLLRKMVGQPIIMIVTPTLGLEIFLRGFGPGVLGAAPKQIGIGVSLDPIILGDVFINRVYLVGGMVALVLILASLLFFRTRLGTKLRAVSDDHVFELVRGHFGGTCHRDLLGAGRPVGGGGRCGLGVGTGGGLDLVATAVPGRGRRHFRRAGQRGGGARGGAGRRDPGQRDPRLSGRVRGRGNA